MTPEQLKASILQYAIQGKLVEQRPEEGTGEELYQRIQTEKQRLIKEGKIKKEKPFTTISDDEFLFDIPDTWKWVRLGDVFNLIMGQSPDGKSVSENSDGMEFHQGKVYFGEDYIQKSPQTTTAPTKLAEPNSVLLCVRAPVGIVNITDRELCIGRGLCDVIPLAGMNERFTLYLLRCFKDIFIKKATGTTFVAITGETVKNQVVPLPPLAEQDRIVAKIEELLPYVDRYAAAYEKLEQFNAKFPEDMKKSILQYAIQGKLVEQRPEEGTGEELYRQIQAEKQRLIKEGKIKKEKPLAEIAEDEIPFDIPESWKWIRFGEVYSLSNGTASRGTKGGIKRPVLRLADLSSGAVDVSNIRSIELSEKEFLSHQVVKDDLIFIRVNGTKARVATAFHYKEDNVVSYCDHLFCGHKVSDGILVEYMMYIFNAASTRKQLLPEIKTTAGQNTISQTSMAKIIIPLPPLAEQKRIVAKLEEILPLCERLK